MYGRHTHAYLCTHNGTNLAPSPSIVLLACTIIVSTNTLLSSHFSNCAQCNHSLTIVTSGKTIPLANIKENIKIRGRVWTVDAWTYYAPVVTTNAKEYGLFYITLCPKRKAQTYHISQIKLSMWKGRGGGGS